MRIQTANTFNERHGNNLRQYDWVAPEDTNPEDIPALIEAQLPGLKLYHRGDGEVNGYINTSRRPDGSLYVCVCLFDTACEDDECTLGEGKIKLKVAPTLTANQRTAMQNAVGEHAQHKLTGDPANDSAVLAAIGYEEPVAE